MQREHIKNILFKWKKEVYDEMVIIDSELVLTNAEFNNLFEKLINKFRKKQNEK